MNDLLGMLSQQVSGPVVDQISKQLGTDAKTTQSATCTTAHGPAQRLARSSWRSNRERCGTKSSTSRRSGDGI